ncbi:MAG: PAS domain S-box protein [bacterium]
MMQRCMGRPESAGDGVQNTVKPLSLLEIENQRLKKQVQEYESLMNNYPHGCLIVQEGKIAYMNKMACKLLGYQAGEVEEQIIGMEFREIIAPEDRSRVLADLRPGSEETSIDFSFRVPTRNGEMRLCSSFLSTSISYRGRPATCFVMKDIIDLNELRSPIFKSKAILQKAVDSIHDGIVVIDRNHTIKMINLRSLHISGEDSFQSVIGRACFDVFQGRSTPCRDCPAQHAFRTQKMSLPVERVVKKNGKYWTYCLSIFPLYEDGEVKLVVKYQRDLSRERQLQDQLIHSEKLATLGMLAGKISHEINNPLSSIIGMAQLLATQNEGNEHLDLIIKEGLRIKKLAQNLTSLGRPSQNEPSDVVLHEVLDTVLTLARETLGQTKHCQVKREYLPDSPVIYGDRNQIEQVFLNLIINAIHALKSISDTRVLTIGTRISPDGAFAVGYVKDNGCGIARIIHENKACKG